MSESLSESPACRILVISSSIKHAVTFIHTIQGNDNSQSTVDVQSTTIPWSITNKYYTAKVHFEAHAIEHWNAQLHAPAVPAIVFVWAQGEPYKQNVECLSSDLAVYDPEVSLAVRIPNSSPKMDQGEDDVEDDATTDEFLSSQGFEFVNTTSCHTTDRYSSDDDDISYSGGIPRLPRVIDALSTIMWPSMQPHDRSTRKHPQVPDVRVRELLDWAQDTFDTTPMHDSGTKKAAEIGDLESWLSDGDPWKDGTVTMSPIALMGSDILQDHTSRPCGFDDDFTVFVSAPSAEGPMLEGRKRIAKTVEVGHLSLESDVWDEDENRLSAGIGGPYASLGSASDFGSEDGDRSAQYEAMEDDEHEHDGLPTEEEIRTTSARIFGAPPPLSKIETADTLAVDVHTPTPGKTSFFDDLPKPQDDVPEDEHDAAPFDLSRVLSTLEGMKAEIAGIEDEGERRKAAARVALGLVHGLEGQH